MELECLIEWQAQQHMRKYTTRHIQRTMPAAHENSTGHLRSCCPLELGGKLSHPGCHTKWFSSLPAQHSVFLVVCCSGGIKVPRTHSHVSDGTGSMSPRIGELWCRGWGGGRAGLPAHIHVPCHCCLSHSSHHSFCMPGRPCCHAAIPSRHTLMSAQGGACCCQANVHVHRRRQTEKS